MKKSIVILLLLAVLAAAAAGVWYYYDTHVMIHGEMYPNNLTQLDLSGVPLTDLEELQQLQQLQTLDLRQTGLTPRQYEQLRQQLPNCDIVWQIPFQGAYLEPDIRELTISSLTEEDMQLLRYFPQLASIDARGCEDLDAVMRLQERYPQCAVSYLVRIGGQVLENDAVSAEIADADPKELMRKLRCLPDMKQVALTGILPENEEIYGLKQAYPGITFLWSFELFGIPVDSNTREIDLSGIPMESVEEVERSLKYFNCLEKVVMGDCGIPSEEMDALWKRHPETRFVWNVKIGKASVPTDIIAFIPFNYGYSGVGTAAADNLSDRDCTEMKYLVDMVCIDLGHMAIRDLSFLQYMPNLEYLLLCENGIRDVSPLAGLKKLKYLELFNNPISDISALAECPALEDVNVTYNTIEDITPLLGLENLNNLWITGAFLTKEQVQQLKDELPDVNLVLASGRSTGSGWRNLPNYYAQRDLLGMWYMTTP